MSLQEDITPASVSPAATAPSLLDEIMAQTRVKPASESYDITRHGVSAFIAAMLQNDNNEEPVNILAVDAMISDIDERTGRQMDAIVHAPEFQELESLLRSLKLLAIPHGKKTTEIISCNTPTAGRDDHRSPGW